MTSPRRPFHTHSSSFPTNLLSNATGSSVPPPLRETGSESGSNPSSIQSSPRIQNSALSPGHPSKLWNGLSRSRDPSAERSSDSLTNSKRSTPKRLPSPLVLDKILPWKDSPRKNAASLEEEKQYQNTRTRVVSAVRPVFSELKGDIAHEVLVNGAELLKLSPIPGLEGAARVLLGIWDALEKVETNRVECLRLTERCADILIAIQEEISVLDTRVADVLKDPMEKLTNAFEEIESMMLSEINQRAYKRYLQRDDVPQKITNCNEKLRDCVGHFDRSISLLVLEYNLGSRGPPSARNDMSRKSIEEIHRRMLEIQNKLDESVNLMNQPNDTEVLKSGQGVLDKPGIEKKDIPDAMKTLLPALESLPSTNVSEKVSTFDSSRRSWTWPLINADANALRLQVREPVPALPSWTITKSEIDLGDIIGRGFFSTVYKGKWGARVVAVKVVEVCTSKGSFMDEVNIWKMLDHPNILQVYGASSVEGSMPWFIVSPLMVHGNVADYLKRVRWNLQRHKELGNTAPDAGHQRMNFLQMIHDVAKGMNYLHEHSVYHGDLKAANVLITEHLHCVVSDFGLSKLVYQSEQRNSLPNHALRWQAPELMAGDSFTTNKTDVYAFAMCSVEILTMGSIPWPTMKDDDVRQYVLVEEGRPPYPAHLVRDLQFENLLHSSWHQLPHKRPSFQQLVQSLNVLRDEVVIPNLAMSSPRVVVSAPPELQDQSFSPYNKFESPIRLVPEGPLLLSPRAEYSTPLIATLDKLDSEIEVPFGDESEVQSPLEGNFFLNFGSSSGKPPSPSKDDNETVKEPNEDQFADTYRMCLSHEFPRQLNFPIWTPGDIQLGDIGYLSRGGQFVKLFNSVHPRRTSNSRMSIPGVQGVSIAVRKEKDNIVRKSFEAISKLVSPGESGSNNRIKRRHTFSLAGNRTAFLCAEKTHHRYIEDSRLCKQWFRNHWRAIIDEYGTEHKLQKEDLMFIVETLSAQHYALFVNHGHLDDNVHFDVFASPGNNEPWGTFILPLEQPNAPQQSPFGKVSTTGTPSKTILVARLRFQTDVEEPTLLNI